MNLSGKKLKRIIKEEIRNFLAEDQYSQYSDQQNYTTKDFLKFIKSIENTLSSTVKGVEVLKSQKFELLVSIKNTIYKVHFAKSKHDGGAAPDEVSVEVWLANDNDIGADRLRVPINNPKKAAKMIVKSLDPASIH